MSMPSLTGKPTMSASPQALIVNSDGKIKYLSPGGLQQALNLVNHFEILAKLHFCCK